MSTFPAVLVTGARQTGTTTLLREEFGASHSYLSLERPDVRGRAMADPVGFLRENEPPLIGRLHALEVKATATPTATHGRALARWLELAGESARGALACRVRSPRILRRGIRAVPWHLAWL